MRVPTLLVSALSLLTACRSDPPPRGRGARPAARPAVAPLPDAAPGTVGATGTGTGGGAAAAAPQPVEDVPPANGEDGVRAFRVAESVCVRDPARNQLGLGVHGYFGGGRLELEVRNVRYSCTPAPVYTARFEDGVVYVRVMSPERAALNRCQCRHDQFLQVTGVPVGDYAVQVEEVAAGDAGAVTVLGRGTIVASADSPPAPAAAAGGAAEASGAAAP